MARRPEGEYWNHNTAYHRWLIKIATRHRGDVLDVGCGDGLLAQRLVPVSRSVTAIDPDATVIDRAVERLRPHPNVTVERIDFRTYEPAEHTFDVITFVASLHHMDLRTALTKARNLLRPGGEIAVVGLSANKTVRDWMWALSCVPGARIGSRLNSETRDIGVAVADPRECLDDIRRAADEILPGVSIRRARYYRYLLRWANA